MQPFKHLRKVYMFACILLLALSTSAQDKLLQILDEEIKREIEVLKTQQYPVYNISFRVDESSYYSVGSSFGTLSYITTESNFKPSRELTVELRVGSIELDNSHQLKKQQSPTGSYTYIGSVSLPVDDDALAIKQAIWNEVDKQYQSAVRQYSKVVADKAVAVEAEDKAPDFSPAPKVESYFEPAIDLKTIKINRQEWIDRTKKYSAVFLNDSSIIANSCNFSYQLNRKYFVSSEGAKIVQNFEATRVMLYSMIKADDGMILPLYESFFAFKPENLATDKEMMKKANIMLQNLIALKDAKVADPYSGPALLTGAASGVFFHEIFGHRVEGQRMKNENDAQTFKKKINELVLPKDLTVYFDPQLKNYANFDLNGYYKFDDQGVKGQKVNVVENGVLKDFIMSRAPIENFPASNGHGRAMTGMGCVTRQSNLIVATTNRLTDEELRNEFIKALKDQNKEFGYFFKEVSGGFTQTGRYSPNAFNVTPLMVYKVFVDGKPDELVRGVNLIGTPLSIFSQISKAGGKDELFTGNCGAESGSVPVSSVSPSLIVNTIETQKNPKSPDKPFILPRPDEKTIK